MRCMYSNNELPNSVSIQSKLVIDKFILQHYKFSFI